MRTLHPTRPSLRVPMHRELKRGTLSAMIDQAGLTVAEFLALL